MTQWGHGGDPFGGAPFGGSPYGGPPQFGPPQYSAPAPPPPRETNTFATLSVIFAFAFAPAGAIFGHLGLNQIKRTGQPGRDRAIIGLALSYAIIAILVVALAIWLILRDTTPSSHSSERTAPSATAPPSASQKPTTSTPAGVPSSPCGGFEPPALHSGRTVDDTALPGLLLDVTAAQELISRQHSTLGLTAAPQRTEPLAEPFPFGTVAPSSCTAVVFAGSAEAYRDSDYRGFVMSTMTAPDGTVIIQTASSYSDQEAAHRALTGYSANLGEPDSTGHATYTPSAGGSPAELLFSLNNFDGGSSPFILGNYFDHNNLDAGFGGTRAVFQSGNVLIDISVSGMDYSTTGDSHFIAMEIDKRLK
ncbi:sensor domain-containing protein [Mycolicibacterium mageritense]|uniref:DUF4190 domain-containing protein n=1 Tax=Mycolicibacterium mageritense TaxID=53462 RepID=A0AAI8XRY4_MYCME|nr:sensor domain-containing protein [Mycolicibacterium mageritense]BDY32545.1 hypothetical protein hbim_06513 [Mycolicibacterium mageritense]